MGDRKNCTQFNSMDAAIENLTLHGRANTAAEQFKYKLHKALRQTYGTEKRAHSF